jgi:hypothetical protein
MEFFGMSQHKLCLLGCGEMVRNKGLGVSIQQARKLNDGSLKNDSRPRNDKRF